MSIGMRILAFIAAVLVLPLFVAGALLVYVIGVVRTALIESLGLPEAPVSIVVNVLNVGILIGTLALAFVITLRLRRSLAARWRLFRLEGEGPKEPERPPVTPLRTRQTVMARVRRLDARLARKPKPTARRRRDR